MDGDFEILLNSFGSESITSDLDISLTFLLPIENLRLSFMISLEIIDLLDKKFAQDHCYGVSMNECFDMNIYPE